MLAWVLRYVLFSAGDMDSFSWMIYGGIILHGVCYDFFFVTGQVYVDKKASAEIRSSAQSFITLLTYGFGLAIGTMLSGRIIDALTTDGIRDWQSIGTTPGIFAAVIAVIFFFTFKENEKFTDEIKTEG